MSFALRARTCAVVWSLALAWVVGCTPFAGDAGVVDANGADDADDGGARDAGTAAPDAGPSTSDAGFVDAGVDDAGAVDAGRADAGALDAGFDAGPPPSLIDLDVYLSSRVAQFAPRQDNATSDCTRLRPPAPDTCTFLSDGYDGSCDAPLFPEAPCIAALSVTNLSTNETRSVEKSYGDIHLELRGWLDPARDDARLNVSTCLGDATIVMPHVAAHAPRIVAVVEPQDAGLRVDLDAPTEASITQSGCLGAVVCHELASTTIVLPAPTSPCPNSAAALNAPVAEPWAYGTARVWRQPAGFLDVTAPTSMAPLTFHLANSNVRVSNAPGPPAFLYYEIDSVAIDVDAGALSITATSASPPDNLTVSFTGVDTAFVGRAEGMSAQFALDGGRTLDFNLNEALWIPDAGP